MKAQVTTLDNQSAGNIDLDDLAAKAEANAEVLAALFDHVRSRLPCEIRSCCG